MKEPTSEADLMPDDLIYANGIDGRTGEYLVKPLRPAELAERARRPPEDAEADRWLRQAWENVSQPHLGLPFDVDPAEVAEAGWAVVISRAETADVTTALAPLIEHRRRQAGDRVRVLDHRPGETWPAWLGRHGVGPGSIDPDKVPYYLLLVGRPGLIPFGFQYLLDVEYAVGRLDLDDADGYRRYAEALVDYEEATTPLRGDTAVFFGTRHAFDGATQLSADRLVRPLADSFGPGGRFEGAVGRGRTRAMIGGPATKQALTELFIGDGPLGQPALLFTATHGLGGWPPGHPDQQARHGALVCQDWPGFGRMDRGQYFAGADLPRDARVHGLVAFLFACYGAGTPQWNPFEHQPGAPPPTVAAEPFVATLPKQLLAHPGGGALAVIGHVERAWGYSFVFGEEAQLVPFQNAVGRILTGRPVGFAMKDFNERYAALSTNISDVLEELGYGKVVSDIQLARLWTERNDAQNYVLLGDPAATLKATRG
jgi:hypothetical protein